MTTKPHIMIAQARFYDDVSDMLYDGVVEVLEDAGVTHESVTVPGALELPAVVKMGHESGKFDGFIALGCVIRGETYHFEVVSNESARGLMDLSLSHDIAVINGVLTCENKSQAIARADKAQKNKGGSFAQGLIDMMALRQKI